MKKTTIKRTFTTGVMILMLSASAAPCQTFAGTVHSPSAREVCTDSIAWNRENPMISCGYEVNNNVLVMTNFPGQTGKAVCSEYKVGSTFYTYNSNGTSKTTGTGLMYVKVGSKYKYAAGSQCIAFARYIQEKLYGVNDGANKAKFESVGSLSASKMTASRLKKLILKGGRGAHLRTGGRQHSFIILKATDTYFTVIDANGTGGTSKVGRKSFTYEEYAKSGWGKRGIEYLNVRK